MNETESNLPLACNAGAISTAERQRYSALLKRVKAAMIERCELSDGYRFLLQAAGVSLPKVAEWVAFERLCCRSLSFHLEVSGQEDLWQVQLSGPVGSKAILNGAFPAPAK
jgi:hypothetical protein